MCGANHSIALRLARRGGTWIALAAVLVLTGCLVHQPSSEVAPHVSARSTFRESPEADPVQYPLDRPWWESFGDPVLNDLVERSMEQNLGLRQLVSRIEEAQALRKGAAAQRYPTLSGLADIDATWRDLDDSDATTREDAASAGVFLGWELDVWGRLRSATLAQEEELEARRFDWLGGRVLLSALVVETYVEILEQRQQLQVLSKQIEVNRTLLELNQLRFGQAQASIVDVLQQREQLASTRSLVPAVEAREGALLRTLDVLMGATPGLTEWQFGSMPEELPYFYQTGVPSDLLANRPDLLAARHRITRLDYDVGEAVANRLPRFEIGARLTALGDPGFTSLMGNAFAGLVGPLIDAGERRAVVDQRRARLEGAITQFSADYLQAVRDVEVALLDERKQVEAVELQAEQLEIAERLLTETRNRYSQGLTDYLPVLAAVATEQNLERSLIRSRRELLTARIRLHRALGGPMTPSPQLISLYSTHE